MKISLDIDCTPEELRTFFGLPDVKPLQDSVMSRVQTQVEAGIAQMDPETMMKTWVSPGLEGFGEFQKMIWSAAMGQAGGKGAKDD